MTEKILTLDLSKETTFPVIIYGRVGDEKMQTVRVKVTRNHQNISLNGFKITFEGSMAGKVKVFDSENVKTDSGKLMYGEFTYTFPSKVFNQSGKYEQAYFSIERNGQRDTTGNFKIVVLDNADIDAQEAETIISQYNKLVKELQELQKKNIAALDNQIAATRKNLSEVSQKVDQAVAKFEKADFYTKNAAEAKFAEKGESYTKQESNKIYITKEEYSGGLTKAVGFGTESDYTVSSSGVVVIPITTSYIDDEIFSVASNKITVKKSGLVAINLSWLIDSKSSASSWINGELYKNSTTWARINHDVKMRQPGAISNLVSVNSGDTFHFQTNSDSSGYIVRQLRAYILFIKRY